jgi:hypothetical protein
MVQWKGETMVCMRVESKVERTVYCWADQLVGQKAATKADLKVCVKAEHLAVLKDG